MAFEKVRGVSPDKFAKARKNGEVFGLCQTFELPIMHMCITEKPLPMGDLQQTRKEIGTPLGWRAPLRKSARCMLDVERANPPLQEVPPAKLVVRPRQMN